MQTQMGAESPNLYIANLPKEQQESKDFVRCICLDNNQKRGRAELLQKNWKTILYLLDEAQFVDADTPPKLDLLQAQAPEEVIKSIIRPEIEEGQVLQKKKMWIGDGRKVIWIIKIMHLYRLQIILQQRIF